MAKEEEAGNSKNSSQKPSEDTESSDRIDKEGSSVASQPESESEEAMQNLPPEVRKVFRMQMQGSGPASHPLASKLNEGHIDKILELSEKDNERQFKDTQRNRYFIGFCILAGIGLLVFLTIFLTGRNPELFREIIKLLITFAGGIGLGYGIKSYKG